MSDTVYLLAYDTDTGDRDEWNRNYTPFEVFSTAEDREKKIQELMNIRKSEEDYDEYGMCDEKGNMFVKIDRKIMTRFVKIDRKIMTSDLLSLPRG